MTQQLITELRKLHARSTDEEDRAILGALLNAEAAANAEPTAEDEALLGACGHVARLSQFDQYGRCPGCVLIWMNAHFSARLDAARALQAFRAILTRGW